ncbi:MAG: hypothetical protein H8E27_09290 [Verrucomicrobia subdivision 3 bacterium]|nr:hypothetical protein [Limisphaerales bacterium]
MDTPPEHQTQNRRAVIDVGSNSVKLLVADVSAGQVLPVKAKGKQTRLGKGVFETGKLQPERIDETARVIGKFAAKASELGAGSLRVLATSAAREAANGADFARAVAAYGLELEIISGEKEANLILRAVRTHPDFADGTVAVMDAGGGSTELLVANESNLLTQASHPLGTVRWLDKFPPQDPPTEADRLAVRNSIIEFLQTAVVPQLRGIPLPSMLVASGGSPKFLTRLLEGTRDLSIEQIEKREVTVGEIRQLADKLWSLPLAARRELPGMSANRADVLLMGAAIYEAVMEQFGFQTLRPSMRGVRYGALLD